jgi:hypothetical protein
MISSELVLKQVLLRYRFIILKVFSVCSAVKDVEEFVDNVLIETCNPERGSTLWHLPRT